MDNQTTQAQHIRKSLFSVPKLPEIKKKYLVFGAIGVFVFIGLIWYVMPYVQKFFASLNPPIEASLIPEKEEVYVDDEFHISMRLSSKKASALELYLTYDSAIVSYGTEYGEETGFSQVPQDYFLSPLIEEVIIPTGEEGKKTLHLLIVSQTGDLNSVQFNLKFKALEKGVAHFITASETKVAGSTDQETATYFDLPTDVITQVTVLGLGDDPGTCTCLDSDISEDTCNDGFVPVCTQNSNTSCICTAVTPTPTNSPDNTATPTPSNGTPAPSHTPTNTPTPNPDETITPTPSDSPGSITPTPSGGPDDSITPTQGDTTPTQPAGGGRGDVELKLNVRFQGVTKQPSEAYRKLNTKVILAATDKSFKEESLIPFTADDSGVWSGTYSAKNVPLGAKFSLFIKGPKHLMKKICETSPSESVAGNYTCSTGNITLIKGAQDIDFSKIVLLVGDIPVQDGVIDAVDAVFVRNNFGSQTSSTVSRGDLNLDGIIHAQDMVLMLKALEFKYDED